jgi:hypothetical protein
LECEKNQAKPRQSAGTDDAIRNAATKPAMRNDGRKPAPTYELSSAANAKTQSMAMVTPSNGMKVKYITVLWTVPNGFDNQNSVLSLIGGAKPPAAVGFLLTPPAAMRNRGGRAGRSDPSSDSGTVTSRED